jgi:hypothetical protein
MKYKGNIVWTVIRAFTFWLVGLMNTAFIKAQDIGTWKNYVGYILLFLALVDTIFFITVLLRKANYEEIKFSFLKVLALSMPFYFIYFPQLHEDTNNPNIRKLWKYILFGFLIYIIGFMIYNLFK